MKKLGLVAALFVFAAVFATAQNQFTNSDFSAGLDPWGVMEMGGKAKLAAENGEMVCYVERLGPNEYAVQIWYDGIALEKGKTYKFAFDVTSEVEREIEYRIQMNGGDYKNYIAGPKESTFVKIGPTKLRVEKVFTMESRTDRKPRVAINVGKWKGAPKTPAHKIKFDNFVLEEVK